MTENKGKNAMKLVLVFVLCAGCAFSQSDMSAEIGNISFKPWIIKMDKDAKRWQKESALKNILLTFPLTIKTSQSRAFPISIKSAVCVKRPDGSRTWKASDLYELSGMIKNGKLMPSGSVVKPENELDASEVNGKFTASSGFKQIPADGKPVACNIFIIGYVRNTEKGITDLRLIAKSEWQDPAEKSIEKMPELFDSKVTSIIR